MANRPSGSKTPTAFRRVIVAAGGGAGIAAVFSAPLGGFVYAIEELLNSARPVILLLVIITTFIADSSADIIQALGLDPKAGGFDFNLGFLIQKEYDPSVFFLPVDFIYLVLLGIIIGMFAELYSRFVLLMQNLGKKWYKINCFKNEYLWTYFRKYLFLFTQYIS